VFLMFEILKTLKFSTFGVGTGSRVT